MRFSLIIPVAPDRNTEILRSIDKLNYPKRKYEVIVEKGTNPSANRNKGIKKSKGKIIIFLDDDAFIKPDYLKKIDEFFKKYPYIDIVGGPQLTPKEGGFFARTSGIVLTSIFGTFSVSHRYKQSKISLNAEEDMLTSSNLCAKKEVFSKISGFNTKLFPGEDPELISRAKNNCLKVAYNPEMIIFHRRRDTFTGFCKQNFLYGLTRPKKIKISQKSKMFFLIPSIFTLYLLLLPTLYLLNPILFLPIGLYIFLAVVFSFYNAIKHRNFLALFALPFLYLTIHLSYGLGMIAGYLTLKTFKKK